MADRKEVHDVSTGKTLYVGAATSGEDVERAKDKERLGSTAGRGLGAKGKTTAGMPKQEPGESLSAYAERMRKYRETEGSSAKAEGQKKALRGM